MRAEPEIAEAHPRGADEPPGLPGRLEVWLGPRAGLLLLLALGVAGLWLRATGFAHGLPHLHHPDVPKQIDELARFVDGVWIPEKTIYPMLHMYVAAFLLDAQRALDLQEVTQTEMVVTARLLNAVLATAAIPLAYLTGTWLLGRAAGLWTAALTAVSSLHVLHAHYAMGDAVHVFLVAAGLAAAARALRTGHAAAFLLGGAVAGLAAAAKFYGGLVFLGLIPAALAAPRRTPRRAILLVALAGMLAAASFALATPKFLADPAAFLYQLRHGDDFGRPLMPPWAERPLVVAGTLGGLAVDWLGPAGLALAALGIAVTLRTRPPVAALLLAPLVGVFLLYAATRASYLDDRNLLVFTVFAYLFGGAALAGVGAGSPWRAAVALGTGAVVVAAASVDALTVAHLFRQEHTGSIAIRWVDRHLGPSTKMARDRHYDSEAAARAEGADVLQLTSYDYARHLYRYGWKRLERAGRAHAFFEDRGKLLTRIELLPRGFTAPTLAYYDLATMDVPYAFPRPDDVARPEPIVFADAEAVPARAGAVVPRGRSITQTVASRAPLRWLGVALSGRGRAEITQGGTTVTRELEPGRLHVELLEPRRSFPWYKHFYPVTVEAADGWVVARLLLTPCDVAWAHLAYEEFARAVPHLEACRGTLWVEPARLLDLAWAHARLDATDPARQALAALEAEAPGLLDALVDLAAQPGGPAWRERYRQLAGHGPWLWHGHTFRFPARVPGEPATDGPRHEVGFDATWRGLVTAPGSPAGTLKVWFPQDFLRGSLEVRVRLRGETPDGSAVARVDVVRHFQRRMLDVPVVREWSGTGRGRAIEELVLPVTVDLEPTRLEVRVHYLGTGWLEVDEIAVLPDVRAALRAKLAALEPLVAARRGRP
jgi:hypothetical protein